LSVARLDGPAAMTVAAAGEIDIAAVGELHDAITAALADAPPQVPLIIDLSGLRFIDSAGIGALLRGRRAALAAGRPFRVTGATGLVLEVLWLTGVWPLLSGETA